MNSKKLESYLRVNLLGPALVLNLLGRGLTKAEKHWFSVSTVVRCGQTDRQTYMTMLIVVSRNFANAPKNSFHSSQ
jgi:hypothetical protein